METDNQHNQIMRAIGQLEGKIDGIIERLEKINGTISKQGESITSLQNWRSGIVAVIAFLAFVIPLVVSVANK